MNGDWEDAAFLIDGQPLEALLKKAGRLPLPVWAETIHPHLDAVVETDGPFPSRGRARDAVKSLLKRLKKPALNKRTIERHLDMYRPNWFVKGGA